MDKSQALAAVASFSETIHDRYRPIKVVPFGSYARGEQEPSSDIDVAVIVDRVDGDFLDAILRTGEVVYERAESEALS